MNLPAETGQGAIILSLIALITKIWMDSSRQTRTIIQVVEENSKSITKLNESLTQNTMITKEAGEMTRANTEVNKHLAQRIEDVLVRRNN